MEQLDWKIGMRSVANETVFERVVVHAEPPDPEAPVVPAPDAVAPEVVPVAAAPEPEPLAEPEVPLSLVPLVVEPLPPVPPLVPQARPTESEAMVAKERMFDVARCMKTVLSA
jgi:hypothetical protein